MATITKDPQASRAIVAKLRFRRRAHPAHAQPAESKVRRAGLPRQPGQPGGRRSKPGYQQQSARAKERLGVRIVPLASAQPTIATAVNPEPSAIHTPRLRASDFGFRTSPARSSLAGCRACFRRVSRWSAVATTVLAQMPMNKLAAVTWN